MYLLAKALVNMKVEVLHLTLIQSVTRNGRYHIIGYYLRAISVHSHSLGCL